MGRVEQKISPAGFGFLREELFKAESMGFGPEAAVRYACLRVGLFPKAGTETVLIVDYSLNGPVFPFMDWPAGWVPDDRATWR